MGPGSLAALGGLGLSISLVLAWPSATRAQPPVESCVTCHLEMGDDRLAAPVKAFAEDIHAVKGFGCVSCHGGEDRKSVV